MGNDETKEGSLDRKRSLAVTKK